MTSKKYVAYPYAGGNETIDRLHDGKTDIWVVNGSKGRKILLLPLGTTENEAIYAYKDKYDLLNKAEKAQKTA